MMLIVLIFIGMVSHFIYLENDIWYDRIYDIGVKFGKFQTIWGTVSRIFKNNVCRKTQLKFLKVMVVPVRFYCSELWRATKNQDSKIQASKIAFLRRVKKFSKQCVLNSSSSTPQILLRCPRFGYEKYGSHCLATGRPDCKKN